ncbi:MAG TPA: SWIM zinc finger family protein [Candidatus Angelobacter sp.]|jgi:uncharacterized Zn finger protein|nr:SWIM zinc finger family protein [Candidatus Angelobacter sp.]
MKKWTSLTWDDLEEWAGSRAVSRGRDYAQHGCVQDLAISKDGRLLATVTGGDDYAVVVQMETGKSKTEALHSECTCPVGHSGCKHAVAVVAAYLEMVRRKEKVPAADPEDSRWSELSDEMAEIDFDEDIKTTKHQANSKHSPSSRRDKRENWNDKIRFHIQAKSREELADFVWALTQRFPEIYEELRERIALGEGDVERLLKEARKELRRVTAEPGWSDHWNGGGHIPDYTRLRHRLERLSDLGHHDAVVSLGTEIMARGMGQISQSNDEGETAGAFAECLPVLFNSIAESGLPPHQKVLFAIDACLQDDYGVIDAEADKVLDREFTPEVWSAVADELARRLEALPKVQDGNDFHRSYERDRISDWLIDALNQAGRGDETAKIYEGEARRTGSYERLVKFLISQKRYDDAEQWAREGIKTTHQKLPGIASSLAQMLSEIAGVRRQWDVVAAHAAWRFFDRPGRDTFEQLLEGAAKAGCREEVRTRALQFLETGNFPKSMVVAPGKGESGTEEWPLPIPNYLLPLLQLENKRRNRSGPHYEVLIDLAIAEKSSDEVLKWYDKLYASQSHRGPGSFGYGLYTYSNRVAEAVAQSHPQRSLDIYRQQVEMNLTQAKQSAYETVASYLRKMRPILKSLHRQGEWTQLLADIRLRYRNRPRFVEILDRLDGKTIIPNAPS